MSAAAAAAAPASELLAAALRYAAGGWPVFPCYEATSTGCSCDRAGCEHAGKHPRTPHGCQDACRDEATIRGWWRKWPRANVAIATGVGSGLVVLDVDPRHGGEESLAALERQHGKLPPTREARTPGGGRHLSFSSDKNVRSSVGKVSRGIDVRAADGYVIAAPSPGYTWVNELNPVPLPDWLAALISEPPQKTAPSREAG